MDTHLARAFCNGIYAWQHTRCHLRSRRTLCDPWKHWAPLTGQQSPPGVPSSYLLNLLCPPWYGFRRPLSFGLHSGFFNYVVHFTCLCSFTPQDQGHKRSRLIISKQEVSTGPHRSITSCFPIYAPSPLFQISTIWSVKKRNWEYPSSASDRHITHVNKEICLPIRRVNKRVEYGISRIPRLLAPIWSTLVATLIDRCSCV